VEQEYLRALRAAAQVRTLTRQEMARAWNGYLRPIDRERMRDFADLGGEGSDRGEDESFESAVDGDSRDSIYDSAEADVGEASNSGSVRGDGVTVLAMENGFQDAAGHTISR
jgi:hypothetical protein